VLAETAFECQEPPEECCVLIGSVEVENGRLTRVINYPRWYLWCFANFFEVLIYTLANDAACGRSQFQTSETGAQPEQQTQKRDGCCPGFEIDVCDFLKLFLFENRAAEYAARSSSRAIQSLYRSLVAGFDFMRPSGVAPAVFANKSLPDSQRLARSLRFNLESLGEPSVEVPDTLSSVLGSFMHFGTEPLAAFARAGTDYSVVASATRILNAPALPVGQFTSQQFNDLAKRVESLQPSHDLESRVHELEAAVQILRTAPGAPTPAAPETPPAPPEGDNS
jgi:hypothetical protein